MSIEDDTASLRAATPPILKSATEKSATETPVAETRPRRQFLRQSITGLAGVALSGTGLAAMPTEEPAVLPASGPAPDAKTALQIARAAAQPAAGRRAAARAASLAKDGERRLRLVNAHTWEKLDIVYFTHGMYIDESLGAIDHLMRDHRANEQKVMDRGLIDSLFALQASLDCKERLHILSGYRTAATNAKLRKRSKGVAKYSLHMEGRAADMHVPGIATRDLQKMAIDLGIGGVGYYGKSGFVHMDTGRVRMWERA